MLKTRQIRQFCNVKKNIYLQKNRIVQKKAARRATGTKLTFVYLKKIGFCKKKKRRTTGKKTDLRLFSTKYVFFQKNAARRAAGTKLTFVYFQKNKFFSKKGRPQGNEHKTDLRLLKKIIFFKKRPPAGQRGQN